MTTNETAPVDDHANDDARRDLAAQMRRGMHLLVGRAPSTEQLADLTSSLSQQFDLLEVAPKLERTSPMEWDGVDGAGVPADGEPFPDSLNRPVSGQGHPFSVPITMYREGDSVVATVTLDSGFEGAPGRSHGGIVSAIFDDLLGSVPMLHHKIAFTASLTINYVAAFPILEPVRFRCWTDRIDGKKIYLLGEAHHGETLVSSASALFIDATDFIATHFGAGEA